jgi:hypothetical protein
MSNFLAVATVTAALRRTLQKALDDAANNEEGAVGGTSVKSVRPDGPSSGVPTKGVNVFLYNMMPNPAWRNADLPIRNSSGTVVQRPRVALDLQYLLSFYGDEDDLEPQRIYGVVARTLHSQPVITAQVIDETISNPPFDDFLASSNLADETERVKFTPTSLSLEELSKIWSVLFQTRYTLSAAYQGTVVFIEGEDRPRQALPVETRKIFVVPFQQPRITALKSQITPTGPVLVNQPIVAGHRLVILGSGLRGPDGTRVRIGETVVKVPEADVSDAQIAVTIPHTAPPSESPIRAGVQAVRVLHPRLLGEPRVEHGQVESNVEALVLRPTIKKDALGQPDIKVQNVRSDGPGAKQGDIVVAVEPGIAVRQKAALQLIPVGAAASGQTQGIELPRATTASDHVIFPFRNLAPGKYVVVVRIDGADSVAERETNQTSPTFGQYNKPLITIPA